MFFGQIEELITINEEILRTVYSEPDLVIVARYMYYMIPKRTWILP